MKKWIIPVVIVAAGAAGFAVYQKQHADRQPENIIASNGRLELERIDVATLYAGRVKSMNVDEGSEVKAGDVLAELSSDTTSGRVEEAQAGELAAKEMVQRAQAGGKQAQEAVKAAQAAKAEALAAVRQAQAQVAEAQAGVSARQAQLKLAQSANNDMQITSPKDGVVEYKIAQVGNVVGSGSKVVSLLDFSDASMAVFLPTTQVGSLKVGDEARIKLDGLDAVFPAKISFIATEAQFTPKNVETANERAKLMFKVKLRIPKETALQYKGLLKGGMVGNGYVRANGQQAWSADLAVKLPQF